jgi:hypothetical protein
MSEPLAETEALCRQILTTLSSANIPKESSQAMRVRVEALLPKIAESRKKLMLRSPKGRELSADALKNAMKLQELISSGKIGDDVSQQLGILEGSVGKMEIYWKSFEYVTT